MNMNFFWEVDFLIQNLRGVSCKYCRLPETPKLNKHLIWGTGSLKFIIIITIIIIFEACASSRELKRSTQSFPFDLEFNYDFHA